RAVSRTTAAWVTDTGATLTYKLSLGSVEYSLSPTNNSPQALVAAINTSHSDKVTAQLIDTVAGGIHDYRISLTAIDPGDLKPELVVSEVNLQSQQTTGVLASYIVNNSGLTVTSTQRAIGVATGVTVELLENGSGVPVNISVTRSTAALSEALSAFADAYNDSIDELDTHYGTASGALKGQSMVTTLAKTLSGLATYTSSGSIDNLPILGLELDKTGHMSFNAFTLMAADFTSSSGVTSFLGSTTAGFIRAATTALNSVQNVTTGLLSTAKSAVKDQLTDIGKTIEDAQLRVDLMTQRMEQQMAAADALVASMQQQYGYLASMFEAMRSSSEQF
ncbi:MAG: flagellar hook-associated 2 domain protein, partial [Thermomicrobiales bacterium]|nr:flagellar hook-associated 2 domain protein [Thermomicrobiales bacterium]